MRIKALVSLTAIALVQAQSSVPRYAAECGLFSNKIYCFGGVRSNFTYEQPIDTTMYTLDLAQNASMSDFAGAWQLINTNTNGVTIDARSYPQSAQISDTQLLISGGFNTLLLTAIEDQTIVYDTATNSWSSYENYTEGEFGSRQIYYGSASVVPGKGVACYGGFEEHINASWTMETDLNLTQALFNTGHSREIGYTSITYLDITKTPIWSVPTQTNVPTVFTAYHSSIYRPSDKRLYFFGGVYQDLSQPDYNVSIFATWHQFNYALYFDTTTNAWGNQSLTGSILPSERILHTTNLLPDSNTVLLYGGETLENIVNDFCFTLDLNTFTWTQQSLLSSDGNDLVRTRHSVIDVDNKTVFILFGLTSQEQPTSTPIALDVSTPSNISYVAHFVGSLLPPSNVTTNNSTTNSGNNSSSGNGGGGGGISGGAIAGIVVGVIAVLAIAGLAFFFFRRKNNKKEQQGAAVVNMEQHNHSQEPIDVNWDEIEKQYSEVPAATTNRTRESMDGGTTMYSSGSDEQRNQVNVPNAIDEIPTHNTRFLLKPDGAGQ